MKKMKKRFRELRYGDYFTLPNYIQSEIDEIPEYCRKQIQEAGPSVFMKIYTGRYDNAILVSGGYYDGNSYFRGETTRVDDECKVVVLSVTVFAKALELLEITVLDFCDCPKAKKMHKIVKRAAKLAEVTEKIKYAPNIKKMERLGVWQTPVITIRGKPVMLGLKDEPEEETVETVKKLIEAALVE